MQIRESVPPFYDPPAGKYSKSPPEIPKSLMEDFTYQGRVSLHRWYINDIQYTQGTKWPNKTVVDMIQQYQERTLRGSYSSQNTVERIRKVIGDGHLEVKNKHILGNP